MESEDKFLSYEGLLPDLQPQAVRHISIEDADRKARKPNIPGFVRVDEPANPGGEAHSAPCPIIN